MKQLELQGKEEAVQKKSSRTSFRDPIESWAKHKAMHVWEPP